MSNTSTLAVLHTHIQFDLAGTPGDLEQRKQLIEDCCGYAKIYGTDSYRYGMMLVKFADFHSFRKYEVAISHFND